MHHFREGDDGQSFKSVIFSKREKNLQESNRICLISNQLCTTGKGHKKLKVLTQNIITEFKSIE